MFKLNTRSVVKGIVKFGVRTTVGVSAGIVAQQALDAVLPENEVDDDDVLSIDVTRTVGTVAIGFATQEIVGQTTDAVIDTIIDAIPEKKIEVDPNIIDAEIVNEEK